MTGFSLAATRLGARLALALALSTGAANTLSAQEVRLDPAISDGAEVVTLTQADHALLRAHREAEIRATLGLAEDEPVPGRRDLTEDQRDLLRAAREDRIRETLGLGDDEALPARGDLSEDQRALLREARQDSIRETLGLADDVVIERPSRRDGFERPSRPEGFDRPDRPQRAERFGRGR